MDALVNCKECFGEIDRRANYCRFCKTPQNKSANFKRFIPFFIIAAIWIIAVVGIDTFADKISNKNRPVFSENKTNLIVTSSEMSFKTCGECKSETNVVVVGFIENKTDASWGVFKFEVRFYDKAGDMIDAISDTAYGLSAPALSEVSFRVMDIAGKEQADYASHKVFINDATPEYRY